MSSSWPRTTGPIWSSAPNTVSPTTAGARPLAGGTRLWPTHEDAAEAAGRKLSEQIRKILGRSLAIREVDAGSCNGCELEIVALNNPVHDIERFGIHFVASPRHADMLLVTGPVTRNMELALQKTYAATPEPKWWWRWARAGSAAASSASTTPRRGGVDASDSRGRVHPRMPAPAAGPAARHPAGRRQARGEVTAIIAR